MTSVDIDETTELREMIREVRAQASAFRKQWLTWLGVSSAGGIVGLLSFAAALPNPDFALRTLLPSLVCFIIGTLASGTAIWLSASELQTYSEELAGLHNFHGLKDAVKKLPRIFSSPKSMANEMNAERDRLDTIADEEFQKCKKLSVETLVWRISRRLAIFVSASAFIIGASYPVVQIASGTSFVGN